MNNRNILVIAAHPDDEVIGCAGTIGKHIKDGDVVYVMSFTDGVGSRNNIVNHSEKEIRNEAAAQAAKKIGFTWVAIGDFPDNRLDQVALLDLVKFIEETKEKIKPKIIYTHSNADLNIDHQRVHQATLTAFRPQPDELWEEIRAYEVASSTEWGLIAFNPTLFVNITEYIEVKKAALLCYKNEMRLPPHARSVDGIESLSKLRGAQAGFQYAESFEIIRKRVF